MTAFDVAETYGHQSVLEELEKHSPAAATEAVSEEPQPTAAPTARPVPKLVCFSLCSCETDRRRKSVLQKASFVVDHNLAPSPATTSPPKAFHEDKSIYLRVIVKATPDRRRHFSLCGALHVL